MRVRGKCCSSCDLPAPPSGRHSAAQMLAPAFLHKYLSSRPAIRNTGLEKSFIALTKDAIIST